MYNWRKLSSSQRRDVLLDRAQRHHPLHTPPHAQSEAQRLYHLTAACYEHRPIIGVSPARMASFEDELIRVLTGDGCCLRVWCVLPNHWHALVSVSRLPELIQGLGRLHGRASRFWNREDSSPGRTCWHGCADRAMRNEEHMYATVNYILNNAVHHGYATRWQEWPYTNARDYLAEVGEAEAVRRWTAHPIHDYGKKWDAPEL